jgi:manganese/zinc/iron transport system permease protein
VLIAFFYKELLVSSFDPGLAFSLGINATFVHYALMCWLSIVVVSAFEAVGAILVIAMLILPGATASLLSQRLPVILILSVVHAALSSVLGFHLGTWLNCSIAAAMVVMAGFLFSLAWLFNPRHGLISRAIHRTQKEPQADGLPEVAQP